MTVSELAGIGDAPRKVLVMLPSGMVGGAERVAFNLVSAMLDRGHEVTVYTMTRGPGPLWPSLNSCTGFTHIASAASSEKRGVIDFLARKRQLRALGPFDLVYTSHVHVNALASLALRTGILHADRLVSRESTRIFDRYKGSKSWIYRLAYRCYGMQDLLIFQTEEMRQSLAKAVRLPPSIRQEVIPNPVNIASVDAAIALAKTQQQPSARAGRFRIVFCGRLIPLKRGELLLNALAQLDRARDWQLDVLGNGHLRQELALEAEQLGLAQKVHFHGSVSNPYGFFAQADLGVLCSRIEGFPNVLLEMMASGTKHIISTPCTSAVRDLPDVNILEEATPDALVTKIAKCMDMRPDSSRRFRHHIETAHSIDGFLDHLFDQAPVR